MPLLHRARRLCLYALCAFLAACSNGSGSLSDTSAPAPSVPPSPPPASGAQDTFSVGGAVTGLAGAGLVLQLNGGGDLAVVTDGSFTFTPRLGAGSTYAVTVKSQPVNQACAVTNGNGAVAAANVTSVSVACANGQYSVGGSVSGLAAAGLVLQNNGGDDLTVGASGPFAFAARHVDGASYNVTVRTHPGGQNCVVANGSGRIEAANVVGVSVACRSDAFSIGGNVTGLQGTGLTLQLNGANDLAVGSNGAFAFATALPRDASYRVTLKSQPTAPSQTCRLSAAEGTVTGTVTSIGVSCTTNSFSIGGSVGGLQGSGLLLRLNGAHDLAVSSDGQFTFAGSVLSGTPYAVTIARQPVTPAQSCTVATGSGTVGSAPITNVRVTCASTTHSVGGSVSGLLGGGLTLLNNGGNRLAIAGNGPFTFVQRVADGGSYRVSVERQPANPAQTCTVSNGEGTIRNADVTGVAVSCTTGEVTIGGLVSGLVGNGLVLRNNGQDELAIEADGAFTFGTLLPTGASYNVTVGAQPADPTQTCTVASGVGVAGSTNVTGIRVQCSAVAVYSIGGNVSDLIGSGLRLRNNGGDEIRIASNGGFTFRIRLPSGSSYDVTVARHPRRPEQRCDVENGTGTIGSSNVQNVEVRCRDEDDDD